MSRINASLIRDTPRQVILDRPWGDTKDIMAVIMAVVNKDLESQVSDFAKQFKGNGQAEQYRQLERLWKFCRNEIRYKRDPDGLQDVKHPARTWADRTADCKSLTVFIYFCLKSLGIPCIIRFASYDRDKEIGHVYPVAILGARSVAVDAVFHRFDAEEKPTRLVDKYPAVWDGDGLRQVAKENRLHTIGGIGGKSPKWVSGILAAVSGIQTIRAKHPLEKILYGGLTFYFTRETIRA